MIEHPKTINQAIERTADTDLPGLIPSNGFVRFPQRTISYTEGKRHWQRKGLWLSRKHDATIRVHLAHAIKESREGRFSKTMFTEWESPNALLKFVHGFRMGFNAGLRNCIHQEAVQHAAFLKSLE